MTPIIAKIDHTRLSEGIAAALQYTKRTPAELVNSVAFHVALETFNTVPATKIESIDRDLSVVKLPRLGFSGKPLKGKSDYGVAKTPGKAPLAALIIQARANPTSNYNKRTGGRWAIKQSPFKGWKGASVEIGRQKMAAMIDRMIKARHSSTNFLKAGFIPAIKLLGAAAKARFSRGGVRAAQTKESGSGAVLGAASAAQGLAYKAEASITNLIGTEGRNAASMNLALIAHGLPALQAAMDREGKQQMDYALKKMHEEMNKLTANKWK